MAWREQYKKQKNSGPIITDGPIKMLIVASETNPWGIGFANNTINIEVKDAVRRMQTPGGQYIFSWYNEGKYWACLKPRDHPGFITLGEMLLCSNLTEICEDETAVSSVLFVKDSMQGKVISKDEAVRLNAEFDPDADADEPDTIQASRKRSSSFSSSSAQGKRKPRCSLPNKPILQVLEDLEAELMRPTRAEMQELTKFVSVCHTGGWHEYPCARLLRDGWIVRYRPVWGCQQQAQAICQSMEGRFQLRKNRVRKGFNKPQFPAWWNSKRQEYLVNAWSEMHAMAVASELLRMQIVHEYIHQSHPGQQLSLE